MRKKFSAFLCIKCIFAVGTDKSDGCCNMFVLTVDLALVLTIATVVVVDEMLRSTSIKDRCVIENGFAIATMNRFYWLTILPLVR